MRELQVVQIGNVLSVVWEQAAEVAAGDYPRVEKSDNVTGAKCGYQ